MEIEKFLNLCPQTNNLIGNIFFFFNFVGETKDTLQDMFLNMDNRLFINNSWGFNENFGN